LLVGRGRGSGLSSFECPGGTAGARWRASNGVVLVLALAPLRRVVRGRRTALATSDVKREREKNGVVGV
jgi:hypothetical protein